jgi:hypothetical protein
MTAPTLGLGLVSPRPRRESATARAIASSSAASRFTWCPLAHRVNRARRGEGGSGREEPWRARRPTPHVRALSPIRTLTVGSGLSPDPPSARIRAGRPGRGLTSADKASDHRRFGISPIPPARGGFDHQSSTQATLAAGRRDRRHLGEAYFRDLGQVELARSAPSISIGPHLERGFIHLAVGVRLVSATVDRHVVCRLGLRHRLHLGSGSHHLTGVGEAPVGRQRHADG